jgi:hypothetical protein
VDLDLEEDDASEREREEVRTEGRERLEAGEKGARSPE